MKRELPIVTLEGTDFIVDVNKLELREKANPENIIAFNEMSEFFEGYSFQYSKAEKNVPTTYSQKSVKVTIPEFVKMDPEGMASKYHIDNLTGKTDFDVMVNQEAFERRVKYGELPTVDIAGHTFYVDIRMNMLRPHDDFLSKGIVFRDIVDYYSDEINAYIIPYNPKTHEFQELDYEKITDFPKDLIAVQFPFQKELDTIGWNRADGWDIREDLKQIGMRSHFKADIIPWDKTGLKETIKNNLEKQIKTQKNQSWMLSRCAANRRKEKEEKCNKSA